MNIIDAGDYILPTEEYKKIYSEATKSRYDFLYLDLKNIRAFKTFTTLLWEKGDPVL